MNRHPIRTGSLTLLLLITTICLAVLAILSLQTAQSDLARTEAYSQNIQAYYANNAAGQHWLEQVNMALQDDEAISAASLPRGTKVTDGTISIDIVDGATVDPDSVRTSANLDDTGIAASGLDTTNVQSKSALSITLSYNGSAYAVTSWNQIRVYG